MSFESKIDENGYRLIWLEPRVVDRLMALRGRGQSFSDVILRLATEGFRASSPLSGGGVREPSRADD